MVTNILVVGILLSQMTLGILGNFSLLSYYLVFYYNENTLRYLILRHLTIANSLVILFQVVPMTMNAFGLKNIFSDFGCRIILYIHRVGRSVSIAITCLLSVFQNIMISPMNSCWKNLKIKAPKYVGFSISLCWILYMVVNFIFPIYVFGKWSSKNMTQKRDWGYCSITGRDTITDLLYVALLVVPEFAFSLLMIWTSGSMIFILYRHKQRVQHIHSINDSHRSFPESRATKSILILVCTFVAFFTLSSIFRAWIALYNNPNWWLVNASAIISVCFPAVSPFILMSRDSTIAKVRSVWKRNTKFSNITTV